MPGRSTRSEVSNIKETSFDAIRGKFCASRKGYYTDSFIEEFLPIAYQADYVYDIERKEKGIEPKEIKTKIETNEKGQEQVQAKGGISDGSGSGTDYSFTIPYPYNINMKETYINLALSRSSPIMNRGYFVRVKAIETLLDRFLLVDVDADAKIIKETHKLFDREKIDTINGKQQDESNKSNRTQDQKDDIRRNENPESLEGFQNKIIQWQKRPKNIIVLGAGFDTLYFRANEKYLQSKNKKAKANKEKVSFSMRTKNVKSMEKEKDNMENVQTRNHCNDNDKKGNFYHNNKKNNHNINSNNNFPLNLKPKKQKWSNVCKLQTESIQEVDKEEQGDEEEEEIGIEEEEEEGEEIETEIEEELNKRDGNRTNDTISDSIEEVNKELLQSMMLEEIPHNLFEDNIYIDNEMEYEERAHVNWFEIDYEDMIEKKLQYLNNHPLFQSCLQHEKAISLGTNLNLNLDHIAFSYTKSKYHLLGIDLREDSSLINTFTTLSRSDGTITLSTNDDGTRTTPKTTTTATTTATTTPTAPTTTTFVDKLTTKTKSSYYQRTGVSTNINSHINFSLEDPTFILLECVLMYMNNNVATSILRQLSSLFPNSMIVTYDAMVQSPPSQFGKMMLYNLQDQRGLHVPGIMNYPSIDSHLSRFISCGWQQANATDMYCIYENIMEDHLTPEERLKIHRLEMLDEVEEIRLLMQHYVMTLGQKGKCCPSFLLRKTKSTSTSVSKSTSTPTETSAAKTKVYKAEHEQKIEYENKIEHQNENNIIPWQTLPYSAMLKYEKHI